MEEDALPKSTLPQEEKGHSQIMKCHKQQLKASHQFLAAEKVNPVVFKNYLFEDKKSRASLLQNY